jgi:hypothetical protein
VLSAPVVDEVRSPAWEQAAPAASVVIATHDRAAFLGELLGSLGRCAPPAGGFEVVLVDDGSTDGTWAELERLLQGSALPVLALRIAATGGPSVPRNTGALRARGRTLLLTDDDCLPDPGWVASLVQASGTSVAQGRTRPGPGPRPGPWDRSIDITGISGLFETCNLGMPRAAFLAAGGFPVIGVASRGFGEDVVLGHRLTRHQPATYCPAAVVHHRWLSTSYAQHLAGRRRLAGFPLLAKEIPALRKHLLLGVFLSPRSAAADAAVVGVLGVAAGRRRGWLAVLPWLALVIGEAQHRPGRPLPVRIAQVALADGVGATSLVASSIRHRRPVL